MIPNYLIIFIRMEPIQGHYILRLLLTGFENVGKSTIISTFLNQPFAEPYKPTIGTNHSHIGLDLMVKTLFVGRTETRINIWDSSGQERFHSIVRRYYRGARAVLVVYSVANRRSFEEA